jgi:DNA-binding transcriptional ArsR family regulator
MRAAQPWHDPRGASKQRDPWRTCVNGKNHFGQTERGARAGETLECIAAEMDAGVFDRAVERRHELVALLEQDAWSSASQRIEAQIRLCRLALPWLDLPSVATGLRPYVSDYSQDGRLRLDETELKHLPERHPPILVGLFYAELSNALFRCLQHEEGALWADQALRLLAAQPAEACGGFSALSVVVASVLAHAWRSRLLWQLARPTTNFNRRQIVDALRQQLAVLEALAGEQRETPSILVNQAYAILCDLVGDFEYSLGRVAAAEELAQRALIVLGDGVHDSARRAHLFYLLGKIQAGRVEQNRYDFAVRLFQRAHASYKRVEPWHPFRFRCEVHEIRCLIREEQLEAADKRLQAARDELKTAGLSELDTTFNRFHIDVTELWILERQARAGRISWSSVLERVQELQPRAERMGLRLRAETYLHLGLALGHCKQVEHARSVLADAHQFALEGGQPSLEVAAHLALAEVLAETERRSAEDYLMRAQSGLRARVRSAFLTRWYRRLEAALEQPLTFVVPRDAAYEAVEHELRDAYLRYHAHAVSRAGGKLTELTNRTGIARTTLLRWVEVMEPDLLEQLGLVKARSDGRPARVRKPPHATKAARAARPDGNQN